MDQQGQTENQNLPFKDLPTSLSFSSLSYLQRSQAIELAYINTKDAPSRWHVATCPRLPN
jgi:hypothetical protein